MGADEIADLLGLPRPTPEQRTVIEAPHDHVLVVAGAGSGKTETMASRVVWLVANEVVRPGEVLGLTFTRKAATELATRVSRRLGSLREIAGGHGLWDAGDPTVDAPSVSTYHAYAGRVVAEHGLLLGVEPEARLLTPASAWQLAHEVTTSYDGPMDAVSSAESTVTRAVLHLSGELAEHLRTVDELDGWYEEFTSRVQALPTAAGSRRIPADVRELLGSVAARRQILPLVNAYDQAKRRRDCLDFADQVALAARLASTFTNVARRERDDVGAVLLDEFQDTSEAQLELLHSLFAAPAAGPSVPVMAVGDPHQAIYGWRGASANTLARFTTRFPSAGSRPSHGEHGAVDSATGRVLSLSLSWRNDERILTAAHRVSAPLADGPVPVRRLIPAPGAALGTVEVARLPTVESEASHVAQRIASAWFRPDGQPTGLSAAVLCRRRAQFPAIVDALRGRGVPVEVVGLGGLLTTPEVQDVVCLLSVVHDPSRADRLLRLLVGPPCRLGAADLDGLAAWAGHLGRVPLPLVGSRPRPNGDVPTDAATDAATDVPVGDAGAPWTTADPMTRPESVRDEPGLVEAIEQLPPPAWVGPEGQRIGRVARRRISWLAGVVQKVRAVSAIGVADVVGEAERSLGLDVEVASRPDRPPEESRLHLDAFADAAASFQASADRPTLGGFLDWLDAAQSEEQGLDVPVAAVSRAAVQVLTVHAAKGLEWDLVAVPGLIEGTFPSTASALSSRRDGRWVVPDARDKGWCVGLGSLPYDLRGDADGLPVLDWRSAAHTAQLLRSFQKFVDAGGERTIREERRLAYVALTRARHLCLLSCSVWTDATTPRVTSRFLRELLGEPVWFDTGIDPHEAGDITVGPWAPMPTPDEHGRCTRPEPIDGQTASWPAEPAPHRRAVLEDAARLIWSLPDPPLPDRSTPAGEASPARSASSCAVSDPRVAWADEVVRAAAAGSILDRELVALLAERDEATARRGVPTVRMPQHLSVSGLVALSRDEDSYAIDLRRPMPRAPTEGAHAGREFHAWVESHFQRAAMLDLDDLPGNADGVDPSQTQAVESRARFLDAEWADRVPLEVELPVEITIAGVAVRGRIDAIFPDPDPDPSSRGVVIVDWKTGRAGGRRACAVATQLAIYRLAYARLRGLDETQVRAAYYNAETGRTVYPDLPSTAELEAALIGSAPRVAEAW
ncbi:MAG: ATP-dependent DNA helicase [Dermatophilaceae bacterium]